MEDFWDPLFPLASERVNGVLLADVLLSTLDNFPFLKTTRTSKKQTCTKENGILKFRLRSTDTYRRTARLCVRFLCYVDDQGGSRLTTECRIVLDLVRQRNKEELLDDCITHDVIQFLEVRLGAVHH